MVYVPYATLQSLTGRDNFDQIAVRVGAQADVERTEERIVSVLENETGSAAATAPIIWRCRRNG